MARVKVDIPNNELIIVNIPVRITDINYGNHVGNDAFVAFIHEARVQWLHQHNFTELDIAETGLIMSDLAVEYKSESFYGDQIAIRLSVGDVGGVSFELYYQLTTKRDDTTILLAKAKSGMVCYDYKKNKVVSIPEVLKKILQP